MRHQDVTLASLALTLSVVGICALFAQCRASGARVASGIEPVERVFARLCADCHEPQELAESLRDAPDQGGAVLDMLEFLAVHGGATDAEDRALLRWICAPATR